MSPNWSAVVSLPCDERVNWNADGVEDGGAPTEPADTSMFWASIAAMTSAGVIPLDIMASGSSHTRIE